MSFWEVAIWASVRLLMPHKSYFEVSRIFSFESAMEGKLTSRWKCIQSSCSHSARPRWCPALSGRGQSACTQLRHPSGAWTPAAGGKKKRKKEKKKKKEQEERKEKKEKWERKKMKWNEEDKKERIRISNQVLQSAILLIFSHTKATANPLSHCAHSQSIIHPIIHSCIIHRERQKEEVQVEKTSRKFNLLDHGVLLQLSFQLLTVLSCLLEI